MSMHFLIKCFLKKPTPSPLAHNTDEKNQVLKLLFVPAAVDLVLQTPLQSSVTCAIISTLRHLKNLCARRNGGKETWTWQESYG